jgi:CRISPR-associated protein Csm3
MANQNDRKVDLWGRVFIRGDVEATTGLHIGGGEGALAIGGVDSPVIRDPITNRPYIPGSSLRGKMRSLAEKLYGAPQTFPVSRMRGKEVYVHICQIGMDARGLRQLSEEDYQQRVAAFHRQFNECPVCPIFGAMGDQPIPHPTSLVVRDVFLSQESARVLEKAKTDLPYSEIKWEATIDRVTSAAVPRQIERVPAGAIFSDFEMVYSIYDEAGVQHLPTVLEAMQLLEDDYLGGLGSRGGGKVRFVNLSIKARGRKDYGKEEEWETAQNQPVGQVLPEAEELKTWVQGILKGG